MCLSPWVGGRAGRAPRAAALVPAARKGHVTAGILVPIPLQPSCGESGPSGRLGDLGEPLE